jgi:CelD/BcsL family acetyltransferase involved in cellulose biosynthesis
MLTLRVIDSLGCLQDLSDQWAMLVNELEASTPFHLPSWQLTWWYHFGSGQLRALAFFEGGTLVGLVPCFRHEWEGARQLTLIGSGVTDFLEPPMRTGYESALVERLGDYLRSQIDWDLCDWQDLSSNTPLQRLTDCEESLRTATIEDTLCTAIPLHGSFEDYWQARSSELKRNVRRYTQKAEAEGAIQFEVHEYPGSTLVDTLIELHAVRWHKRGEPGMIAANRSADFLRDIAAQFANEKILRLLTLKWKGQMVAVIFAFSWRKVMYGYLSAFDPEHEKLGFGRILLFNAVRHAANTGHNAWNFLRGDEPYKIWWGAQPIRKSRLIIKRNSAKQVT